MNCKQVEKNLWRFLDSALSEAEANEFASHLERCEICTQEVQAYQLILREAATLEKAAAPDHLWQGISETLDSTPRPWWQRAVTSATGWLSDFTDRLLPAPAFKIAGALALLIFGIFIGRYFLPGVEDKPQLARNTNVAVPADSPQLQQVSYRAENYIEKSKVLFLGVVNADKEEIRSSDWSSERKMAQGLVKEAAFLKDNLSDKKNARVKQLVEELEMILLEIANMERQDDLENIELIRSGIDREGLLLKIQLHDFKQPAAAQSF